MDLRSSFIVLIIFFIPVTAKTQQNNRVDKDSIFAVRDSVIEANDSAKYAALQKYSQKSKLTRFLYHLFFAPVIHDQSQIKKDAKKTGIRESLMIGKPIRTINITTLDPFGSSITDTSKHPGGFVATVNKLHVKTRTSVIRNHLLFGRNSAYDTLLVNESARLIRLQDYVQDVKFTAELSPGMDSVDIHIRVVDTWSLIPNFSQDPGNIRYGVAENNFAGLGDRFNMAFQHMKETDNVIGKFGLVVPNINSSYIDLSAQYLYLGEKELERRLALARNFFTPLNNSNNYFLSGSSNMIKSLSIQRNLFSPVAYWAGGLFMGQTITTQSYVKLDSIMFVSSLTNLYDFWGARSWNIFKRTGFEGKATNLVLSGRHLQIRYPGFDRTSETNDLFAKTNMFFTGIGITSRKYVRDTYIFNYGKTEDIPVGRAFGFTLGMEQSHTRRIYYGFSAAWGDYFQMGYLSTHIHYGTFSGSQGPEQGLLTSTVNYFTPLFSIGSWKIRQFISPTMTIGFNRSMDDNITFVRGMKGFENVQLDATRMLILTLQTQSYARLKLLGFNFGPFVFASFGIMGNDDEFIRNHIYSLLGAGVLIRNNYLIFKTFQISLSFYPFIPDKGYNIFRPNAYKTTDYRLADFEISKPGIVDY